MLTEDDSDHRIEFCEMFFNKLDKNEIDLDTIIFLDGLTLILNGEVTGKTVDIGQRRIFIECVRHILSIVKKLTF